MKEALLTLIQPLWMFLHNALEFRQEQIYGTVQSKSTKTRTYPELTQLALGVGCVRCGKSFNVYEIIGADAPYS